MNPESMLEAFKDPQMRHAAIVHLPVALSLLALIPAAGSVLFLGRRASLRATTVGAYLLLLVAALIAVNSGGDAEHAVDGPLSPAVHETIEEHEEMAEAVWVFALGTAVLAGAGFLPGKGVRPACAFLALGAGLASAGWVAQTAHHGGTLVYGHRIVVPAHAEPPAGPAEATTDGASDPRVAQFVAQVKPILEGTCMKCHNPRRRRRSGNLDQTTMAGLLEGGLGGPALVPGDPDASLIIQAIRGDDPDFHMPPKEDRWLTPEQIAAFEQWVRDGAVWR